MTDTYISDEMVEAAATHLEIDFDGDEPFIRLDSINAALEAIAPALIREGMERAAEVIDDRIPVISQEQAAAFSRGDDRLGYQIHARHCEAATIAAAIRTAKEEV